MLTITRRSAKIGSSVNVRNEKHGDEDVPACDIAVASIMLEPEELNALLEDPRAHDLLFVKDATGFVEPAFPQLNAFALRDKFEDALVQLHVGLAPTLIELKAVKLARVSLALQPGGLTAMSLQVQATPAPEIIGQLSAYMNHEISIEITDGKRAKKAEKQDELPLQMGAKPEEPKHPEDLFAKKSGRTRRTPASTEVN